MESIIGIYKTECVRPGPFHNEPLRTISDIEFATMAWVDWYNNRRLHGSIGMIPRSNTKPPTTPLPLPSTRSDSPHESGREPVTVHTPPATATRRPIRQQRLDPRPRHITEHTSSDHERIVADTAANIRETRPRRRVLTYRPLPTPSLPKRPSRSHERQMSERPSQRSQKGISLTATPVPAGGVLSRSPNMAGHRRRRRGRAPCRRRDRGGSPCG
jgi:hypothetical protein